MKRYDIEPGDPYAGFECVEDPEGEWVWYEDVKEIIDSYMCIIESLRDEIKEEKE